MEKRSSVSERLHAFHPKGGGGEERGSFGHRSRGKGTRSVCSNKSEGDLDFSTTSVFLTRDVYPNANSDPSTKFMTNSVRGQTNGSAAIDEKKIYVSNIKPTLSTKDFIGIFANCGNITSSILFPQRSIGDTLVGLIEFENAESAKKAIEELQGRPPHNLFVKYANAKRPQNKDQKEDFSNDSNVKMNGRGDEKNDKTAVIHDKSSTCKTANREANRDTKKTLDDTREAGLSRMPPSEDKVYDGTEQFSEKISAEPLRSEPIHNNSSTTPNCNGEICEKRHLMCPYKFGSCRKCSTMATDVCSQCKEFYCSTLCFLKDSHMHVSCVRRDIVFRSDGSVISAPRENTGDSSDKEPPERHERGRVRRNGNVNNAQRKSEQKIGVIHAKKPLPKVSPVKVTEKAPISVPKRLLSAQTSPVKVTEEAPIRTPKPLPLPENTYSEVSMLHFEGDTYFVLDVRRAEEMAEIIKAFGEANFAEKPASNPRVGNLYASLYDGEWCRCEISSVSGNFVDINYIDFGNSQSVERQSLRVLPPQLQTIEPLAIPVKFSAKVPFSFNKTLRIKPIRMIDDFRLSAQIEPDSTTTPETSELPSTTGFSPRKQQKDFVSDESEVKPKKSSPARKSDESVLIETLNDSVYEKVVITHSEKPGKFWVTKHLEKISDFSLEIGSIHKKTVPSHILKEGEIYGFCYDNVWCRARLESLIPLRLFFLDYGNTEEYKNQIELIELPRTMTRLKSLSFRIELEDGFPKEYLNKVEMDVIEIKLIRQIDATTCLARVIDSEKVDTLPSVSGKEIMTHDENLLAIRRKKNRTLYTAKKCSSVELEVYSVLGSDSISGILITDSPDYISNSEISRRLSQAEFINEDVAIGSDVLARVGASCHRGYVVKKDERQFRVALVDYGRVVTTSEVAPLPNVFKPIFENSVRVIFDKPLKDANPALLVGKRFKFDRIKGGTNCMKAHSEKFGSVGIQPWEALDEEVWNLELFEISSGSKVVISFASSAISVYVQALSREQEMNEFSVRLASYCKKANFMTRKPLCGEIVACKYHEDGEYYRAKILGRQDETYRVLFSDFGNTENVTFDSFKELSSDLKRVPYFSTEVRLKDVPGPKLCAKAVEMMNNISIDGAIFTLVFDKADSKLVILDHRETGKTLNAIIAKVENPQPSLAFHPFMVTDLRYEPWPAGQPFEVGVIAGDSLNELICMIKDNTAAREFAWDAEFIKRMSILASQTQAHVPRPGEMCLSRFEGDWFRSQVLDVHSGGEIQVFFTDYGNQTSVTPKEVRRMPAEFMEPRAFVKRCDIINAGNLSRANLEALVKDLSGTYMSNCYLVEEKSDRCLIWTDFFDDDIKKLGFPLKDLPPV